MTLGDSGDSSPEWTAPKARRTFARGDESP